MFLRKLGRYLSTNRLTRSSLILTQLRQGAARLPEFSIRVDKDEGSDIHIVLNVKFPKAYPSKAIPILSITQSKGLTSAQVNKLLAAIHAEAQRCLGSEAIFAVSAYA